MRGGERDQRLEPPLNLSQSAGERLERFTSLRKRRTTAIGICLIRTFSIPFSGDSQTWV